MDDDLNELRFQLYEDRFALAERRLDALEEAHDDHQEAKVSRSSMMMNWLMIVLFIAEVIIGSLQLLWVIHHA